MSRACLAAVVLVAAALTAAGASELEPVLAEVLVRDLRFGAGELADLERGRIVRHGLGASTPGEVAVVGAVRVSARKESLVERYRDIEHFKRGPDVPQIGRFSSPPTIEDLAALTLTREDLDLRGCRLRDCDVRLPAETIGRVQHEIDWNAPDADERAAALFKSVLLDQVRAYLSGGPGLMTAYDDDRRQVRPVNDLVGLLRNSPYVDTLLPGLSEHLRSPSEHPLAGAEDFLYWSKEKFGLTPFVSVTHVSISPAGPGRYVIASRDVYSSRYFDASLTLTVISDAAGAPGAFYLVYINRSRANGLKGSFAGLRRAIVERRVRDALEEQLRNVKRRLEQPSPADVR